MLRQPDRDIGALFEPDSRTFDYVEWIARPTSHMPDKGCQMIHYFAAYSLLCQCGSKFEVISIIEAPHLLYVAGKILASIKLVFEVLQLQEDDAGSDAYC